MALARLATLPSVSVVVNTLDRAASLCNTLLGLRQLRYPHYEIIVVPGPCRDETADVLSHFAAEIRVETCSAANLSVSRNVGLQSARGDILAFIDDDAIPEPDWLDHLVFGFLDPEVGAVGGFIRDQTGITFQHQFIVANRFGESRCCPTSPTPLNTREYLSPTGTNVAFRRDCLSKIGGFDEEYSYFLDETDVNLRVSERGWLVKYVPEAEVHHRFLENRVRDKARVPRSQFELGRSKAYFCWKNARPACSDDEIRSHLNGFRARARRQIGRFLIAGRLPLRDARRMCAELDRGMAAGAAAAEAAPGRARGNLPVRRSQNFDAATTDEGGGARRPRVCWVRGPEAKSVGEGDLAGVGGTEVAPCLEFTIVSPVRGATTVAYSGGVWRHDVASGNPKSLTFWRDYAKAVGSEIERVLPRRQFDVVFCPIELHSALIGLASHGVQVRTLPPGLTSTAEFMVKLESIRPF